MNANEACRVIGSSDLIIHSVEIVRSNFGAKNIDGEYFYTKCGQLLLSFPQLSPKYVRTKKPVTCKSCLQAIKNEIKMENVVKEIGEVAKSASSQDQETVSIE